MIAVALGPVPVGPARPRGLGLHCCWSGCLLCSWR
ncbi:MAG: hypothetical protein DLM56_09930 [Pseudonocardiales bacterium]|nr:MAG: hypothetical protein DLM56_09930 [Pseudonocardiales bacterium]